MYSGSAESTDLALNKLKELKIDESKYFVEKDSKAFEESLESVSGIKHIIKNTIWMQRKISDQVWLYKCSLGILIDHASEILALNFDK